MRNLHFKNASFALVLLALCLLAFGPLLPLLGFYWDDWPTIWHLHLLGPSGFADVFAVDRPLLGYIFMLTSRLLGESTLAWQAFALLGRWAACLSLWWMLTSIWPRARRQAAWVAILFAIYPGFLQQPISVTYSADWLALIAFFTSFALLFLGLRRPALFWPMFVISWLLATFVLFADEYYFGIELLRPVFVWIVLGQLTGSDGRPLPRSTRLKHTFLIWLPYAAMVVVFLYWRLVLHVSPRGDVSLFDQFLAAPLGTLMALAGTILNDLYEAALLAWGQTFNIPAILRSLGPRLSLVYALVAVLAAVLAFFYVYRARPPATDQPSQTTDRSWAFWALSLGAAALLLSGWPFWITALPIRLYFPWDRFTLALMFGACLMLVGLLELLRPYWLRALLLALLVGLAAGFHLNNSNEFRKDWEAQKLFFWQLTWRAPSIETGTALLTTRMPLEYYSDNSLSAPLNWVYAPQESSRAMPYLLMDLDVRLGLTFPGFEPGQPIEQPYRATSFSGTTSDVIALYYPTSGCVKVLDPVYDKGYPLRWRELNQAQELSDTSRILAQPAQAARPPAHIFGDEPPHHWCYYFERAELARQQQDWEQVAAIGEQVAEFGYKAIDPSEWLPFIEADARLGRYAPAVERTLQVYEQDERTVRLLCHTWARVGEATSDREAQNSGLIDAINEVEATVPCD